MFMVQHISAIRRCIRLRSATTNVHPDSAGFRNRRALYILGLCLLAAAAWFWTRAGRPPVPPPSAAQATPERLTAKRAEVATLMNRHEFRSAVARLGDAERAAPGDHSVRALRQDAYQEWAKTEIQGGRLDSALGIIRSGIGEEGDDAPMAGPAGGRLHEEGRRDGEAAYEKAVALGTPVLNP